MNKSFRNNGAIGALLDEYEKAITELQKLILTVSDIELMEIVDQNAKSSGLYSIQNILSHVLRAGNWYNVEIRKSLGEKLGEPEMLTFNSVVEYQEQLSQLLTATELIFKEYDEADLYLQRNFRWKHIFNIDVLLEHAIVHILRHRRQIEKFITKLKVKDDNQ